jgi:hypothetical protein
MNRLLVSFTILLASGCQPPRNVSLPETHVPTAVLKPSTQPTAFRFDDDKHRIYLDTRVAPPQRRRFDIGQGSVTLETLSVKDNRLTFRYTPEVEGGYTIYECTVPISPTQVEFQINRDGTPGKPSLDLSKCKIIRRGNLHLK